jgi:alpha-beta hydrolase superfamily lysophospholipase
MAKLRRVLTRGLIALAALIAAVFGWTFVMILWSDPVFTAAPDLSPGALAAAGISFEQPYPAAQRSFRMHDGTILAAQYLPATSGELPVTRGELPAASGDSRKNEATTTTTVVYVHGILGCSFLLNRSSGLLREAAGVGPGGLAEVIAIDLRGHGSSAGRPGDVDYIGQYEDDLGEVIREVRATRPGGRVILAGHSMGGGIALRYAVRASERRVPPVDGYLLFAPYLGWEAPTTRRESPPEAEQASGQGRERSSARGRAGARFMQVHVPRIIGLKILNGFGITAFNGLRVEFFNLPPDLPLRSYSYRAMEDGAPSDYRTALAAVRAPLLVVAGSRDEAFKADEYGPVVRGESHGTVTIVADATHNSVVNDPRTMAAVKAWVAAR